MKLFMLLVFPSNGPFSASKVLMTKESLRVAWVFTPTSVDASYEQHAVLTRVPAQGHRSMCWSLFIFSRAPELPEMLQAGGSATHTDFNPRVLLPAPRWRNLKLTLVDPNRFFELLKPLRNKSKIVKEIRTNTLKCHLAVQPPFDPNPQSFCFFPTSAIIACISALSFYWLGSRIC